MANEFVARNGVIAQSNSQITGSLVVTDGITGSLFGTSSWATNAITANTASYFLTSSVTSASFATSASYARTSSFAITANTASYFLTSSVTSASFATSASYALNATNALTASYFITSSVTSASFATSASYAATSSYASDFTVANTLTATTLVVQTVSSSVVYSSGSNVFGNSLSNTQVMTGSVSITGSLSTFGVVAIDTTNTSNEGNLFLGAKGTSEGGQLFLQKGTNYNSASMLDNYQDQFRILTGTDTTSNRADLQLSHVTRNLTIYGDVVAYGSSDERLKENIQPIENALDKLDKIGGYTFDWNYKTDVHGHEGHDIGVIAQEIEEVLPEVVTTRDNGYKAVKYEKLTAFLIQVNKEQQQIINDQQRQIDELRELINIYIKTK